MPICSQPSPVHPPPSNPTCTSHSTGTCSVSSAPPAGGRPRSCHPLAALMFMVSSGPKTCCCCCCCYCRCSSSYSPTYSLLRDRERERQRAQDCCCVSRSRPSDSRGLSPLIHTPSQHFLHNCHPPFHRSYATEPSGYLDGTFHRVFLLRQTPTTSNHSPSFTRLPQLSS